MYTAEEITNMIQMEEISTDELKMSKEEIGDMVGDMFASYGKAFTGDGMEATEEDNFYIQMFGKFLVERICANDSVCDNLVNFVNGVRKLLPEVLSDVSRLEYHKEECDENIELCEETVVS